MIASPDRRWAPTVPTLVIPVAVAVAVVVGAATVTHSRLATALVLLPCLVAAWLIRPERLFGLWLFCAPFVQGASADTNHGHSFYKFLYLAPPLLMVARLVTVQVRRSTFWIVDVLPALFLVYIVLRAKVFPATLTDPTEAKLTHVYGAVAVGVLIYYFLAFAKTSDALPTIAAAAIVFGGIAAAVFGIIDAANGWNLWGNTVYDNTTGIRRAVGTFSSPAALGSYVGTAVVFAIAILVWNKPRSLRLPSLLLLAVAVPASYLTYTRGPVVAVLLVGVAIALLAARTRRRFLLVLTAAVLFVIAGWGYIASSKPYRDRFGVTETASPRLALQHVSVELFKQKPALGWGYATFDAAKLTVPTSSPHFIQLETSHNTFLTILVETGAVGLVLLVLPWGVVASRTVAAARRGLIERWFAAATVGSLAAFVLGALTYDVRFFSLVVAVPWIAVGLARASLADARAAAA